MVSDSILFQPIKIGALALQHRVVLAPLTRCRSDADHAPVDIHATYYSQRATPGGLLISEATSISPAGGIFPGVTGIYTEKQVKAWKKVTDAVHAKGGFIFLQLWHVGRAGVSDFIGGERKQPVSASAIAIQGTDFFTNTPYHVPHPLSVEEIQEVVTEFVLAAKNAITAGFDGVELHGANGHLLHQFLASQSNHRTDAYGGSIENRARFVLEVIAAVSKAIGADRVGIRLSPWNTLMDVEDEAAYETYGYVLKQLQADQPNLAYVHFVEPRDDTMVDLGVPGLVSNQHDSLDPLRPLWNGPFISSGGYSTRINTAFETAQKTGDLIAFGRTFIANPDLVERLKNGWELNKYDRSTFYSQGEEGYTDYPTYS